MTRISALVGAFGLGFLPSAVTPAAAQVAAPIVMAQGLDNPRGLAFGPDGVLYVVEAGRGGNSALCLPNPGGAPGTRCYGPSGAVTRIASAGVQQRVLIGLPSLAGPTGAEATGPHDLAFGLGLALITVGSGGDPALLTPLKTAGITQFGSLLSVSPTGVVTTLLDVSAYETANNPAGGPIDSNLFGLELQTQAPARALIADAGANALLQVDANLVISTLATFPTRQVPGPGGGPVDMEAVPTSTARGPDGSIYIGELTGFPFPVGGARVYRVPANGGTPVVVATDFTNIIDIAVGADGSAYVLEHDVNGLLQPGSVGRLTKIGPFGARTELAAGLLVAPGKIAIGDDNAVYVTTNSNAAGTGQVLKIAQ
ncbi:MAG: ScyD/ScyE family protein [Acidobacteriota bacterium]